MKIKSAISKVFFAGLLLPILLNCRIEVITSPTVTVTIATNITAITATTGGEVTADGGATVTARGICWSTNQNPTTADSKTSSGSGTGSFTCSLTGLTPGVTYNIRAYATNSVGTVYSSQSIFTTLALAPVLTTTDLSAITSTTVTSGGNITNDGGSSVIARGVCWSKSQNPTIADTKTTEGTGSGSFTSAISGLTPGTIYYFRAYATNSIGTAYGNQVTAITTATLAVLTTTAVSAISSTTVTSGGNITSGGGAPITARGVCWSTSSNPTTANSKTNDGAGTGSFTSSITSLAPGATYYVKAYATNSIGTAYGNEFTLTATAISPVLTTGNISNITAATAVSGGNITTDGGSPVTARGVCWSTSSNPTTANSKTTDGAGTGSFTSPISGLTDGVTYYVRAYATNNIGTAYGNEVSFSTINENGIGATLNGNCWCTKYVANEVAISSYPDARKWTVGTLGNGYIMTNNPQTGDIIVMNQYYNGTGEPGHIGIVKSVVNGNNKYTITIHGANQPGAKSNECNCDNVSDWVRTIQASDISDGKATFYRRTPLNFSCFQVENTLSPPSLVSPINNATVTSVQMKWQIVPNASEYMLEIDGNQVEINSGTQSTYNATLNYGQHQWRACTKNSSGVFGSWSSLETFTYQQNTVVETCNGIDDNFDGIIDNLSSCWTTIYRFQDPNTGARCWNNTTTPPNGYKNYIYEIEAWVSPSYQLYNTFQLVQCSKQTDHILVEKNSSDYYSLINSGYQETANLGYVWSNNGVSHSNIYFANSYSVCKVYRFSYTLVGGLGSHFFTRGADNVSNMKCEMPPRFEVITNHSIFTTSPCP
ncbi:MAG: CHAP domain-containing protein [Prolixibacteraceae bacterium]|nr:CHAP domain-containing protein [Prolixibacteraceae bacterium]